MSLVFITSTHKPHPVFPNSLKSAFSREKGMGVARILSGLHEEAKRWTESKSNETSALGSPTYLGPFQDAVT